MVNKKFLELAACSGATDTEGKSIMGGDVPICFTIIEFENFLKRIICVGDAEHEEHINLMMKGEVK